VTVTLTLKPEVEAGLLGVCRRNRSVYTDNGGGGACPQLAATSPSNFCALDICNLTSLARFGIGASL